MDTERLLGIGANENVDKVTLDIGKGLCSFELSRESMAKYNDWVLASLDQSLGSTTSGEQ